MSNQEIGIVQVIDLGLIAYKEAWDIQTRLHKELIDNKRAGYPKPQNHYLLLCEHPPVFTLGKSGSEDHIRINDTERTNRQIEYFKINRGGDITFHGPGQLVGYPILDLDLIFTDVHKYVRSLEETIIKVLALYDISGSRNTKYTGVWVKNDQASLEDKKICAIGVHLSRWVTMHGFAFNVNTDLSYFDHIVPCGISETGKSVCSLSGLLNKDVDLQEIKMRVSREFGLIFNLKTEPASIDIIQESLLNS